MENSELIDKLNRAYQMEEEMSGRLIELCQLDSLPSDLSEDKRNRLYAILVSIKSDTFRHKEIVLKIKEEYENR